MVFNYGLDLEKERKKKEEESRKKEKNQLNDLFTKIKEEPKKSNLDELLKQSTDFQNRNYGSYGVPTDISDITDQYRRQLDTLNNIIQKLNHDLVDAKEIMREKDLYIDQLEKKIQKLEPKTKSGNLEPYNPIFQKQKSYSQSEKSVKATKQQLSAPFINISNDKNKSIPSSSNIPKNVPKSAFVKDDLSTVNSQKSNIPNLVPMPRNIQRTTEYGSSDGDSSNPASNVDLLSEIHQKLESRKPSSIKKPQIPPPDIRKTEGYERIKCPKCASKNVKEVDDKSVVLDYYNNKPLYRKQRVCKNCKHTWI